MTRKDASPQFHSSRRGFGITSSKESFAACAQTSVDQEMYALNLEEVREQIEAIMHAHEMLNATAQSFFPHLTVWYTQWEQWRLFPTRGGEVGCQLCTRRLAYRCPTQTQIDGRLRQSTDFGTHTVWLRAMWAKALWRCLYDHLHRLQISIPQALTELCDSLQMSPAPARDSENSAQHSPLATASRVGLVQVPRLVPRRSRNRGHDVGWGAARGSDG